MLERFVDFISHFLARNAVIAVLFVTALVAAAIRVFLARDVLRLRFPDAATGRARDLNDSNRARRTLAFLFWCGCMLGTQRLSDAFVDLVVQSVLKFGGSVDLARH
jgi:hypothetical protein